MQEFGINVKAGIDGVAVDGLSGVENSLAYEVEEIEKHIHNVERWLGISGDQSGNNWAIDTLTPFQAISGANTYGADANDEAKVLGTDDTPIMVGTVKYDPHELFVLDMSEDSPYKLRLVYGTGTMAAAISAGQYSEEVVRFDPLTPNHGAGVPIDLRMPRLNSGVDKLWIQAWNVTNNATIDFLIGVHEYVG